jgi:hypothetical protein
VGVVLALGVASCTSESGSTTSQPVTSTSNAGLEGAPTTRAPSIGLTDTGDFGGSVTARLTQANPVLAAPIVGAPEEPAISVVIEIDNGSAAPIGLDGVVVTLTDSASNPPATRHRASMTVPQRPSPG